MNETEAHIEAQRAFWEPIDKRAMPKDTKLMFQFYDRIAQLEAELEQQRQAREAHAVSAYDRQYSPVDDAFRRKIIEAVIPDVLRRHHMIQMKLGLVEAENPCFAMDPAAWKPVADVCNAIADACLGGGEMNAKGDSR